jgi:hypothetical protein
MKLLRRLRALFAGIVLSAGVLSLAVKALSRNDVPQRSGSGTGPAVSPLLPGDEGASPNLPLIPSNAMPNERSPGGTGIGPGTAPQHGPLVTPTPIPTDHRTAKRKGSGFGPTTAGKAPTPLVVTMPPRNWIDQTQQEADAKSVGCMECHKTTDAHTMHTSPNVVLGCTDCHGGNPRRGLKLEQAHVHPAHPEVWVDSANPVNSNVALNHESAEFVRFINPGDLRAARQACGLCHGDIVDRVSNSMMNHGAMLWTAAAYNNGAIDVKDPIIGQAYGADGVPLQLNNPFTPTAEETRNHGILKYILPLHRFNVSQPGNLFRIFEKGGQPQFSLGVPSQDEPPGRPARRLSERGLGTLNRTDPVFLSAQKTRLHDPLLGFLGSNDHPGDYRSSGCSACHVVYANDRSPTNSGWWSKYGNQGLSFSSDPTIPTRERGHPILHQFTRAIPSSQCMNCHMHQGNAFVNTYLGYTWWDQETDAEHFYPKVQHDPTDAELVRSTESNPEAAAARGLWGNRDFLEKAAELNPQLKDMQIADYHSHGWIFRAVFKEDRKGNRLDLDGKIIPHTDYQHAVHLKDIHLAKGMQCGDCHFHVDVHGNGNLYGEMRAAVTIECIDCHGTITERPRKIVNGQITMPTSGPCGDTDPKNRRDIQPVDLMKTETAWHPRFEWDGDKLYQNSSMSPNVRWEVPQTVDVIDPQSSHYNAKARYAKTLQRDGVTWGEVPSNEKQCRRKLAHSNESMDCQICHTAWATSCFGCHLPMKANQRVPLNKFEGVVDRNYTTYNPQVVRSDVFMLGLDSTVKNHRMAVIRSSSAVVVGSQNANREWVYSQQQTVSGDGYSGQAFNPHFAHTTSARGTTKNCTDCHLSKANDNNAWMAQLLGFGTGTTNFFGRYAWLGGKGQLNGVVWTEADEPQSVIGSSFQKTAYPRNYQEHLAHKRILTTGYSHSAEVINDLTLRSEYLYTANGPGGLEVFDVANIDQKGFSERIITSPVSPLGGQRTYVRTKYATAVAMPDTQLIDPRRVQGKDNEEQPIHPMYGYVFVADREEGLVIVNVAVLFDGDPENNFLRRARLKDPSGADIGDHFNPEGILAGASHAVCAGHRVYVCTARGLAVVDIDKPEQPRLVGELADGFLRHPHAITIQFRYAFVTDDDGLKVVNIADPEHPRAVPDAVVKLNHAAKLYVARTYAYVANGPEGLAIVNVENPERPRLDQTFTADGLLNDTRAVQVGSVAASMYALVADGRNGLRVIQLISPDTVEGASGFTPRPAPHLIATYPTPEPMLAVSRGLDRDRVVDETGNQTVVFGRRGARPFHIDEMQQFLKEQAGGTLRVEDVQLSGEKVLTKAGRPVAEPLTPKKAGSSTNVSSPPSAQSGGAALPPPIIKSTPSREAR